MNVIAQARNRLQKRLPGSGRETDRLSVTRRAERLEAERRQGDAIAAGEEDVWGWRSPAGRVRAERRARLLIKEAGLAPGVRCLELGCGTGEFTLRIAESGCDLVGVDISEATAAICRDRVGSRADIAVGDIETGAGLEGPFDAIVGVSVLHHVDLESCLATTFSLLRPGGRFAFSEPNMINPQIWAERNIGVIRRLRRVTPHETAFTPGQLRRAFSRDFEVETCVPFDFLHPATPRSLIRTVTAIERVLSKTALRTFAGSIFVAGKRP